MASTEEYNCGADNSVQQALRRALELDRARIAQTIHDHFGFLLMLTRLRLRSAKSHVESIPGDVRISVFRDEALAAIKAADVVLKQLSDAARQLQNELQPAALDNNDLAAALATLRTTFVGAGLAVALSADALANKRFPAKIETTAYWLTQHALTNVLRHSGINRATVTADIVRGPIGETLRIVIEDSGKGFAVGQIGSTFGLTVMRDRASLIGGNVVVDSLPGRGTRVIVNLPTSFEVIGGLTERNPDLAERS